MGRARELGELAAVYDTGAFGFRNRIINGAMRIDQRNNGASVTVSGNVNQYIVDRFIARVTGGVTAASQRSATAPAGFVNSLLFTVSTGASAGSSDVNTIAQRIEGFNIADLGWGTASAQAVTLSFWVRSSITGTYAFRVGNGSRTYVATYTVNSANTFEQKTLTIPGDTSGTWATDNSVGMFLNWDLGSGSSFNTTAGAWQAGDFLRTSGSVNLTATTGATFYITGVQLEAGSVATPFERRDYGRELQMCQRYYHRQGGLAYLQIGAFLWDGASNCSFNYQLPVTMRAVPTFSRSGSYMSSLGTPGSNMAVDASASTTKAVSLLATGGSGGSNGACAYIRALNDTNAFFDFSAEL